MNTAALKPSIPHNDREASDMSEAELLKNIRPLKLLVNPVFFVTFRIDENGFSVSKPGVVVGVFFLLFTVLLKVNLMFRNPGEEFEEYLENYGSLIPLSLCILSFAAYVVNSKAIAKVMNEAISKTPLIGEKHFYRVAHRFVAIQVGVCSIIPLVFTFSLVHSFYTVERDELSDTLPNVIASSFFYYFIILHFAMTSVVFSNGILFCQRIIRKANEHLQKMNWNEHEKPDAFFEFFKKQERPERPDGMSWVTPTDSLVPVVMTLDDVCQLCVNLNEFFGIPLAACFISDLTNLILSSYYVIKYGILRLWMFSIIIIFSILRVWLILYACENFTTEMRNTGYTVARLIIEGKSSKRKELLQQFSILLFHRKVKFTACGLFSLDYKLIYSALATVAAYLTIAYQFEIAITSNERPRTNLTEEIR